MVSGRPEERGHQIKTLDGAIDTLCIQIEGNNKQLTFVNMNWAIFAANLNSPVNFVNELNVKLDVRDEKLMEVREDRNGESLRNLTTFMLNPLWV